MLDIFQVPDQSADRTVTGGGTGLGLVTANALADNGCKVYITGRRKEPLEAAKRSSGEDKGKGKGEIIPIVADVSTKEGIIGTSLSSYIWYNGWVMGCDRHAKGGREVAAGLSDEEPTWIRATRRRGTAAHAIACAGHPGQHALRDGSSNLSGHYLPIG